MVAEQKPPAVKTARRPGVGEDPLRPWETAFSGHGTDALPRPGRASPADGDIRSSRGRSRLLELAGPDAVSAVEVFAEAGKTKAALRRVRHVLFDTSSIPLTERAGTVDHTRRINEIWVIEALASDNQWAAVASSVGHVLTRSDSRIMTPVRDACIVFTPTWPVLALLCPTRLGGRPRSSASWGLCTTPQLRPVAGPRRRAGRCRVRRSVGPPPLPRPERHPHPRVLGGRLVLGKSDDRVPIAPRACGVGP
jgi:hypothetical protein